MRVAPAGDVAACRFHGHPAVPQRHAVFGVLEVVQTAALRLSKAFHPLVSKGDVFFNACWNLLGCRCYSLCTE